MLLDTNDTHGRLCSGGHIVLEGFCLDVYWQVAPVGMASDDYNDDRVNFETFRLDNIPKRRYHQVWFTKPDDLVPELRNMSVFSWSKKRLFIVIFGDCFSSLWMEE